MANFFQNLIDGNKPTVSPDNFFANLVGVKPAAKKQAQKAKATSTNEVGTWMLPGKPNTAYSGIKKAGYVPAQNYFTAKQPMSIANPTKPVPKTNFFYSVVSGITKLGKMATDYTVESGKIAINNYGNASPVERGKMLAFGATEPLKIGTSLVKKLVTTVSEQGAFKLLKEANVADDIAKTYAPIVAKTNKEPAMFDVVKAIEKAQNTTKITGNIAKNDIMLPMAKNTQKIDPIAQEARKYGSAEEFVKAQEKTGLFNEYNPSARAGGSIVENIPLTEFGYKPTDEVIVYRGVPKGVKNINDGDWVTTNKQLAKDYAGTGDIVSIKIKAKELFAEKGDDALEELVYSKKQPLTKSQLTDIWNAANKKTAAGAGKLSEVVGATSQTKKLSGQLNSKVGISAKSIYSKTQPLPQQIDRGLSVIPKSAQPSAKEISINSLQKDITSLKNSQINTTKLNISDEGKSLIEKTANEIKPKIEKYTGKTLTNKEAVQFAEKTSDIMEKAAGREATLQWEAALLNARQKMAHAAETGKVDQDFIDGLLAIKTQGTDIARKLQSFGIGADPKDGTSMQAIIEAVLQHTDKVDEALKAAQGVDFTDLVQATQFYRKFVKPTAGEWIDLLRYNSMLSSPLTHIVNIFSNLMNTATVKPIEKVLAGGFDFLGSTITGKERTMFAGESGAYMQGYFKNVKDATKRLSDVMQGKRVYTNLDVRQIPVAVSGAKGAAANTLSFPLRLLEGMDQFFTALSEAGEKAALELRASKGVKVGNIATQAQEKAAYTVYRQGLFSDGQGSILNAIDHITASLQGLRNNKSKLVSTIAKFTLPFVQTPMNIFKQGIEYSPAGFSTIAGAANKTEQLTKAIMGSAVFAGITTLLMSNRLSWAEPANAKTKAEYRAAGKQPYSVKIGNKWVSYQKLPPVISFPFAMVSLIDDLVKNKKIDDNTGDLIMGFISQYGAFLADQSYVKSIGDLLAAAQGDEYAMTKMISNYPQQLIPFRALGGWITRLADETQRVADNKAGFVEQQIQWLMTNMPGLSQKVPARMDSQGNPVKNTNTIFNAFSPMKMSSEDIKKAKDFEEILNLKKLNQNETIKSKDITQQAETLYQTIKNEPDQAQKKQMLLDTIKNNPDMAKKLLEIGKDEAKNLTYLDRQVKALGVENGERAKYIIEKLKTFKTNDEKKAYLADLIKKGLVTKAIVQSLKNK